MEQTQRSARELPRTIGLWTAVALLVGSTIGSGIFRSPAAIAERVPSAGPMMMVWVAGGLFALCGALTIAELAGAFPQSGGPYVFLREAWGRLPAFLFGWAELAIIRAAALGAISTTFAEYFMRALGNDPSVPVHAQRVHYIAAAAIIITGILNYLGVRWGSLVQNATTVAKYGALLVIIIIALSISVTGGDVAAVEPAAVQAVPSHPQTPP